MRRWIKDDTEILNQLQNSYEMDALAIADEVIWCEEEAGAGKTKLEVGKDYFACPSCGRPQIESTWVQNWQENYKPKKCYSCGWKPTKKQEVSARSWKGQQIEITKQMIASLIPPPKTPASYFETSGLSDIKSEGMKEGFGSGVNNWGKRGSCWGFAISALNALHIPSMTFDLSRKEWTHTISHETAHLSPKRGKTLEELSDEKTYWFVRKDPKNPYGGMERRDGTKADKFKEEKPEIYQQMLAGWPDNKIPTNYIRYEFEGGENINPRNGEINWGAGNGHGYGWYNEYQSFKGILLSKFSTWINDPKARKATRTHPSTYTEAWFRAFGYANKDEVFKTAKSPQDIELFGDSFYKEDDDLP